MEDVKDSSLLGRRIEEDLSLIKDEFVKNPSDITNVKISVAVTENALNVKDFALSAKVKDEKCEVVNDTKVESEFAPSKSVRGEVKSEQVSQVIIFSIYIHNVLLNFFCIFIHKGGGVFLFSTTDFMKLHFAWIVWKPLYKLLEIFLSNFVV